ncbi:hypothetical protein [Alteromonas sp. 14N.309.X.WAT.G.H12]|uniref:hypothetical protein n=1 Tax=Alteromonas sp. 14N.309.X.WAT.G.H12 TaxID=3120824 RepID=UPI002FD47638
MRIIRGFLLVFVLLTIVVVGIIALVIEAEPLVQVKAAEQVADADTVHDLLEQVTTSIEDRHQGHVITVSTQQIDSIVGFLQRAKSEFRGYVKVAPSGTQVKASLAIPFASFKGYINIDSTIVPADRFVLDKLKIGDLYVPGELAVSLVEWLVNRWTNSDIATQARTQVENVSMDNQSVSVTLRPLDGFLRQLNEVKNGLTVDQDDELRDLTAYYLRYISWQDITLADTPQPMIEFVRLTMKRAQQKSTQETAVTHNRAAILALAIFIGHHRVANFVGDVQPDADKALRPASLPQLRGRNDLARHFLISAALKVLSEQGVTLAIGEFKELMDRAMGGSGYSFVDLTADMAGVEFARVATTPETARAFQQTLSVIQDENTIMPAIDGLVEGLSKQAFIDKYEKVDSPAYLQEVERIRQRLRQIPLYQ